MNARALIENDDLKDEILSIRVMPSQEDVDYALTAKPDEDSPVWERPTSSRADGLGHDEMMADRKRRYKSGDTLAWCVTTVTARWTDAEGTAHEGHDSIGGCYNSERFKQPGGYYDAMKSEAYDDLLRNIERYREGRNPGVNHRA